MNSQIPIPNGNHEGRAWDWDLGHLGHLGFGTFGISAWDLVFGSGWDLELGAWDLTPFTLC